MTSLATLTRVPPHLRHLIVRQDYSRYTAVDQAVWRFVLLQTHARLKATAHAAYAEGLGQTGISVERIPRIEEMDERLSPFGWGAVCVDGFIPPRAFQELQALSILPIATDMRTAAHLVYTPAPDIIHEAAGHAPILPDATYASYLRRVGAAGARAFTLPEDIAVDRAVHALSELKELPSATPEAVAAAERALGEARGAVRRVSEASRLSRLYWWTAEYGLVGTPADYKLYGAGLLSSLWESLSCHDANVRKLPLSDLAVTVDYDVTRPQPQLFVTPSFEQLHDVLDAVVRELPSARGGEVALSEALAAREVATITLGSVTLFGVVASQLASAGCTTLLSLDGRAQVTLAGERVEAAHVHAVIGECPRAVQGLAPGPIDLPLAHGVRLRGELLRVVRHPALGAALLVLASGVLSAAGRLDAPLERGDVVALCECVTGAHAGAPSEFFPETGLPETSVPKPHSLPPRETELLGLYETALAALREPRALDVVPVFEAVHLELARRFEHDWLLRWNLLESLRKLGIDGRLVGQLQDELERLELHYRYREPIASGLRYLADTFPGSVAAASTT